MEITQKQAHRQRDRNAPRETISRGIQFLPGNDSPEQLRKRFNWLYREGALSDEEFKQRMDRVEALAQPAQMKQAVPGERMLH